MSKISKNQLKKEIDELLQKQGADLSKATPKKVLQQLEEKLDCDLTKRKAEIDEMIIQYVNSNKASNDDEEGSEEEDSEPDIKKRRSSRISVKMPAAKEQKNDTSVVSAKLKKSSKADKKKPVKGLDSDSNADPEPKVKRAFFPRKKKAVTGFTRPYQLSPELAELMGQEQMARYEVIKKIYAIIKEKKLGDPNDKQYAICDEQLYKVFGVERFKHFGMMKYLGNHFLK